MEYSKLEKDFKIDDSIVVVDQWLYRGCRNRTGIIVDIIPYGGTCLVDIIRVKLDSRFMRKSKTLGFEPWQIIVPIK